MHLPDKVYFPEEKILPLTQATPLSPLHPPIEPHLEEALEESNIKYFPVEAL